MAVQSRPTLRSSSRKNVGFKEDTNVPPLILHQNPLPTKLYGKRKRDHSFNNKDNGIFKKHRSTPPKKIDQSDDFPKKSLPLRDRPNGATNGAVTSRPLSPSLRHIDHSPTISFDPLITQHAQHASKSTKAAKNTTHAPEKRSLRSHDGGSRSKSELALYFPNYDELISIEPKEPESLNPETIFYIIDEPSKSPIITTSSSIPHNRISSKFLTTSAPYQNAANSASSLSLSATTFTDLNNATRLDFSSLDKPTRHQEDPLADSLYLKPHRRAERQEKQLRNIEKERAMHEKVQLERLFDGLRGHDWLRVMGISGITDSEKKAYEPKRDYFIREVRVLLKKFQEWKEEEKRRKVEKEESMMDEDEDMEEEEDDDDEDSGQELASHPGDGNPSDYNIFYDPAARQLHQEAVLAAKPRVHHRKPPPLTPQLEKPFTSFYSKRYLREAAIGKHRRGRARFAFGQPLPEPPDRAFELGDDILTPDTLAAQDRKRRIIKRRAR